jgi:hypothetical protein
VSMIRTFKLGSNMIAFAQVVAKAFVMVCACSPMDTMTVALREDDYNSTLHVSEYAWRRQHITLVMSSNCASIHVSRQCHGVSLDGMEQSTATGFVDDPKPNHRFGNH